MLPYVYGLKHILYDIEVYYVYDIVFRIKMMVLHGMN